VVEPLRTRWTWSLRTPPSRLWPAVSYTERFNKAIGLPEPDFTDVPHPGGGTVRDGAATVMGWAQRWRENPYEWIEPSWFEVTRDYEAGPLKRMVSRMEVEPGEDGGSSLSFILELTPSNVFGWVAAHVETRRLKDAMGRVYRQIDDAMQSTDNMANLSIDFDPYELLSPRLDDGQEAMLTRGIATALATKAADAEALKRIGDLIRMAPDHVVERMRPWVLARRWQTDRNGTLDAFLVAAYAGLVDLNWSVLCPNCRAESEDISTLGELEPQTHCTACNINYTTEFTESVELTFRPTGNIRPVVVGTYCIGGPGSAPHAAAQQWLAAGEERQAEIVLESGSWRVFGARSSHQRYLQLDDQGGDELQVDIGEDGTFELTGTPAAGRIKLRVVNGSPHDQIIRFDRAAWRDDAATASKVTTRASFRRWFSAEVLSPGTHVDVGSMAVLFTDLKGSTALYEQVGDATAYARVREHFGVLRKIAADNGGTVVKTIGDAIMAVWSDPVDAVKAALAFQPGLDADPATNGLVIKVGVHHGRCIGVNLNDVLDYFGTTVNHAARLERVAGGGQVALSDDVASQPTVAAFLADLEPASLSEVEVELKGLSGSHRVVVLSARRDEDDLA